MKSNFGILPELIPHVRDKRARYSAYVARGSNDLAQAVTALNDPRIEVLTTIESQSL